MDDWGEGLTYRYAHTRVPFYHKFSSVVSLNSTLYQARAKLRLIVITEICQISRNQHRQGPEFCKLRDAIWLTVMNEMFKFPFMPILSNQLFVWTLQATWITQLKSDSFGVSSFQTTRKWFRKLQESFKFRPQWEHFLRLPEIFTSKWYFWTSFWFFLCISY